MQQNIDMSLISASGLWQKKRTSESNCHAIDFEFEGIKTFRRLQSYVIDLSNIENEKCMFLFDSINDGYRIFLEPKIFDDRLFELTKNMTTKCEESWSKSTSKFFVIRTSDLIQFEALFFELFIMYRFSGLMGVRNNTDINQLKKTSRKWSWHNLFSIKRWKSTSDWFLFFDGEHLVGDYQRQ